MDRSSWNETVEQTRTHQGCRASQEEETMNIRTAEELS
jgi:hypothetical protein